MQILILCDEGAAQACADETTLKVLETGKAHVIAEGSREEVTKYCWSAQTALDILFVLARDVTPEKLKQNEWPDIKEIVKDQTFAVNAKGFDENFDQNDTWGAPLKEALGLAVNLDAPGIIVTPYNTEKEVILGLSLVNKDLRKRDYRVFTSNTSLRATIAAAALRLANYTGEEKILIPYEDDGTLAVEAAFMAAQKSPFSYTGLSFTRYWPSTAPAGRDASIDVVVPSVQYLKAVQKNAKIAGVHKNITVTKAELDWLDTKYDEHSFERVVAHLPCSGKRRKPADAQKIARELAYQLEYVLKKGGSCTILTMKPDEHAPAFTKFKEEARHELHMGGQPIWVIRYGL